MTIKKEAKEELKPKDSKHLSKSSKDSKNIKTSKETTTSKKVKVQGSTKYINQETGEVENFEVIQVEDRDFNFHKLWLGHVITSLDLIGNEKIKVLTYLLETANRDNVIIGSQRAMAERIGVSVPTVNVTLKSLIESNLIRMVQQGVYVINPEVIFKGTRNNRMNVLLQYTSTGKTDKLEQVEAKKKKKKKNPSETAIPEGLTDDNEQIKL